MSENKQELSVTDLAVLKNIIDLACERGAFRGPELKTVGETYDKLTAFLAWVVAQAETQSQSQGENNA
jgi:hypothetical protein